MQQVGNISKSPFMLVKNVRQNVGVHRKPQQYVISACFYEFFSSFVFPDMSVPKANRNNMLSDMLVEMFALYNWFCKHFHCNVFDGTGLVRMH